MDSFLNQDFTGTGSSEINRLGGIATPRNVQTVDDRIRQVFGVKVRLQNEE